MQKVLSSSNKNILTITLNNKSKRNAFDNQMSKEISSLLFNAQENNRVVVIESNIENNVFSSGHDLHELNSLDDIVNDPMFEMFDVISNLDIPVIAKVSGDVYAGALHLLMVCDLVYALDTTKITMPLNKMGIPFGPKNYAAWLAVMGIHQAKELFFTAEALNATDAYNAGIFNSIYSSQDELDIKVSNVCERIINCARSGISNSKLQMNTLSQHYLLDKDKLKNIEVSREEILNDVELKYRVEKMIKNINKK